MPTPRKWPDEATRKREYRKRRKEAEAARAAAQAAGDVTDVSPVMQAVLTSNPNKAVLESIRDNTKALDSDRIRAASEIKKIEESEATEERGNGSELRELRRTIEALPVSQRLAWLLKEKNDTAAERGWNPKTEKHEGGS